MDPQTLPSEELHLYNTIKQRYQVAFEPFRVGDHALQLLKILSLIHI